jgi:hypothetical protein
MVLGCPSVLQPDESACLELPRAGLDRVIEHFEVFDGSFTSGTVEGRVRLGIIHLNEKASGSSTSQKKKRTQGDQTVMK